MNTNGKKPRATTNKKAKTNPAPLRQLPDDPNRRYTKGDLEFIAATRAVLDNLIQLEKQNSV